MKKMTATNWTNRTAVSAAADPRTSPTTFPPMINPTRLRDAPLAKISFFPSIPNNPTPETIKIVGTCNPNDTSEGIPKIIHGASAR